MASFLTCWLVIPLLGEELKFTPWGILSGLFWVPVSSKFYVYVCVYLCFIISLFQSEIRDDVM